MLTSLTSPQSPHAKRHLVRVYEFHISTIHKYPFFAHDSVFLTERRILWNATMSLAKVLINMFRRTPTNPNRTLDKGAPTPATLQELTVAALTCPGFSESQKATLVHALTRGGFAHFTNPAGMNLVFGGTKAVSNDWPFQVLAITPGAHDMFVEVSLEHHILSS